MAAHRHRTLAAAEAAYSLRQSGLTLDQIADRLCVTQPRAAQLVRVAGEQRGEFQPVASGEPVKDRRCSTCEEVKPITDFHLNGDGYRMHRCRVCENARRRESERRSKRTMLETVSALDSALWRPVWDALRLPHVFGETKGARKVRFRAARNVCAVTEEGAECATN